jgi:hypothetical protein
VRGELPYTAIYQSKANSTGCIGYDTIDLYFFEQPAPAFAGRDTIVFLINTLQLKADPPTAGYGYWDPPTSGSIDNDTLYNTFARDLEQGENIFTWNVENGEEEGFCSTSSHFTTVIRSDVARYNGFSPNGDMDNEYFIMQGVPYADDFTFRVFNSLGTLVRTVSKAEAENMEVDESKIRDGLREDEMVVWDGRSNNGNLVPSGTYFFVISFPYAGINYEYKDYVVVVRE